MRVHVGPVPSRGVSEWIEYARKVLAERTSSTTPEASRIPSEVLDGFLGFLDEWESVAASSETFLWETDVDPEQIDFLALALFKVASSLSASPSPSGDPPPEGELFYQSFVNAFLDAMASESHSLAIHAEELRTSWPGLESSD